MISWQPVLTDHQSYTLAALQQAANCTLTAYVAKTEKIVPSKDLVETEIARAKEQHKDINLNHARSYFEHIFTNQAVFDFLEKQK